MQANNRDAASLWDMAQAIRRIERFSAGLSFADYLDDELVRSAVERQFEILGEAARRVSEPFQQAHPEIDWRNVIGLRNVIAHRYDTLEQETLWVSITNVLPDLLIRVEALLPPLPDDRP